MGPAIVIVDYKATWPEEFGRLGDTLRAELGEIAKRIDHIGSTSVPGLAAKDVIDIQVTVGSLKTPSLWLAMERAGATSTKTRTDHQPPGLNLNAVELEKRFFRYEPPARRAHIHVRQDGRFNQLYPLLCRDYLITHPDSAAAYAEIKRQLAKHFRDDSDAYYDVKDPTFDLIMSGAREWADSTSWAPPPSDS